MYMCTCMFAMYLVLFIVLCYLHIHNYYIIANIVVCERNKDETKLLIGCENGTLVSYSCVYTV